MTRRIGKLGMLGLLIGALALPGHARASEAEVVQQILGILKDRGIVDDGEYNRLVGDYAASQSQRSWLDKISFEGDFRARHESFWFSRDDDVDREERPNRYRGRYRVRLAMTADVNEWADVHVRLASGEDDSRSTNQSFGQDDADFDPDQIFIDRAYVELKPPEAWVPEGIESRLRIGKQGNLFLWKVGQDFMLWDGDIELEGVGVELGGNVAENLSWFFHGGYFIDQENSSSKDPHVWAAQLGGELAVNDATAVGLRGTYYGFDSLDENFVCRGVDGDNDDPDTPALCDGTGGDTSAGGNIVDGLTGRVTGGSFDVGEIGLYLEWTGSETFPVTLYGNFSQNFGAESSVLFPQAGKEDTAWGVGLEVGDKKRLAKLGAGYWEIEANAFPSQFIDGDLFDGRTNRKGWAFYGSRQLFKNTDLNLTLFVSDEIEDATPAFDDSLSGAKRVRLQSDLVFKF